MARRIIPLRRLAILAVMAMAVFAVVLAVLAFLDIGERFEIAALATFLTSWVGAFVVYLMDSRRAAKRAVSTVTYSRLAADRSRRTAERTETLLRRPYPLTTDLLDQRIAGIRATVEAQQKVASAEATASAALILDDLESLGSDLRKTQSAIGNLGPQPVDAAVDRLTSALEDELNAFAGRLYPQIEGVVATYSTLAPKLPLPPMRSWAISPDLASYLVTTVLVEQPGLIVECGSGVSTVLFGKALSNLGAGRVVALEHEEDYAEATSAAVRSHGVEGYVEVVYSPLKSQTVHGEEFLWYDVEHVDLSAGIDVLFVDGPPGNVGKTARYPAVPILLDHLNPGALVIIDDAYRSDERSTADLWIELLGASHMQLLPHEKGTAVLRRFP